MRRVSAQGDAVVVVGAGTSALALELARTGDRSVVAVDVSSAALDALGTALGEMAHSVTFVRADVREFTAERPVAVWHDRATFHFLTDADDQQRYAANAAHSVRAGGHLVLAGFAEDGPEQCSGLTVARHDAASIISTFGPAFELIESFTREHTTPWESRQTFRHSVLRRTAGTSAAAR